MRKSLNTNLHYGQKSDAIPPRSAVAFPLYCGEREKQVFSLFPPKSALTFSLYFWERENQWPTTSQNDLNLWGSREVAQ